jgi:GntR family transcriptional regulator/MocR family aminotransferase
LQKTLSAFIEKDYLNKHLRNTMKISVERKNVFHNNFSSSFGNEILLDSSNKGLNVIGHLKNGIDDQKLAEFLNNVGVTTYPLSSYFNEGVKKNGLVMGYSSVNNKRIKDTIYKMAKEYQRFLKLKHT